MRKTRLTVQALLLLFFSGSISAQNQLSGIVTNIKNGATLQYASIYIPDLKIGTVSNSSGQYLITNIPPGFFLVEVSMVGFGTVAERIHINGGSKLDISLTEKNYELNEVMLTGVANAIETKESPVPVDIINKSKLFQLTSTNIIDAISNLPGVSQITVGPAISKPVIRGLGYNRVVVINDGVRQEGQQWFDEFGIEIDENSVSGVEILKGPASLRYGSDAMAGVINFISPVAVADGGIKGHVMENYQTNNGLISSSAYIAGNKKGFAWDILYSGMVAHDYKNKYDGYVWNSGYGQNNLKTMMGINRKWGYSHLVLSMVNLKLGIIEGARDSATGKFEKHYLDSNNMDSLDIAPESQYKSYNNYPVIHQHVRHYKAVLDNSFVIGKARLNLIMGLQVNHRQEANDISKGDIYNNYFYLRTLSYDAQYILPAKNKWEISVGANGMQQSSQDRGIVFVLPEYHLFDIGIFSLVKKSWGRFSLAGGLRADSRSLHGLDLYVDSSGTRVKGNNGNLIQRFSDYHSNFTGYSGSIGVVYEFTKSLYGKINLARGFRAPTAAESGQNGIHDGTPFYEIGEHDLKPENSLQLDGTFGINSDDLSAEVNVFTNRINHYIFPAKLQSVYGGDSIRTDNVAGLSGPTFKYIAGNANLSGGELRIDIHPQTINWVEFETAFSMVRAIQLNVNDSARYLPYTPTDKWQSKLKFTCRKLNNTLRNSCISFGVDKYFDQNRIYYQFGDETVTPGYLLVNASISTDIYAKGKNICSIYLTGNNLGNLAYQSNMSRLKYTDENNVTGRTGVFNMGRNIGLRIIVPFVIQK